MNAIPAHASLNEVLADEITRLRLLVAALEVENELLRKSRPLAPPHGELPALLRRQA